MESHDVGSRLVESFKATLADQVRSTLARRIHAKVRDARSDPDASARRWPFELVQNAHDAGPRPGAEGVTVYFQLRDGTLRFEHDAAPFTMPDVAALLTGGSSKDFDSGDTTGRFGTGFLVTHVLSESVRVDAVLQVDGRLQGIDVLLDRPDDESLILENLDQSESALEHARHLPPDADRPTARFIYHLDDEEVAATGLETLESALPQLFGTCRKLKEVHIEHEGREVAWVAAVSDPGGPRHDLWVEELEVFRRERPDQSSEWRVLRVGRSRASSGRLVTLLRKEGEAWEVSQLGGLTSIYRQLPLLGAPLVSRSVVIDGDFHVDEERSGVHLVGDQGAPLREAMNALGGLASLAAERRWKNSHRLAQLAMPSEGVGERAAEVWREVLSSAASTLAGLPLIETVQGEFLPAVPSEGEGSCVDFIMPSAPEADHMEIWRLGATCTRTFPPTKNTSPTWSEIAEGWKALDVPVNWIDLKGVGRRASEGASELSQLAVDPDPLTWLSRYLEAVGKHWKAGGITEDHVAALIPDQHGKLRSSGELRRDGGVSDQVKRIGAAIGLDFMAELLDEQLIRKLSEERSDGARFALDHATGERLSEGEAVRRLVTHLGRHLPEDRPVADDMDDLAAATLLLLVHLWNTKGPEGRDDAWEIPLLSADGKARRAGQRRLMVPPIAAWPEAAQPFATAYPPGRVLHAEYGDAPDSESLLEALASWGIAHAGLVVPGRREELRDRALRAIASDPSIVAEGVLREPTFTQLALLEPELLNHCRQSRERARALLGLVVRFVASYDDSWRSPVEVTVQTPDGERELLITPSLWLADLRSKPWIPVEDEEAVTHHIPSPEVMRTLIDPEWLEENPWGADLLVRHFALDALDVRLLAATKDEGVRKQLRDGLARIVEVVGHDPQLIDNLVANAQQRLRRLDHMRRLGLAVQDAVKRTLEGIGLRVEEVDHGYDFRVTAVEVREDDPEDLTAFFKVGEYKVEVKTTTTGEVRLSPLQASTSVAQPGKFVLCVVDLRDFSRDVHEVDWSAEEVADHCRMVSGAQLPIGSTLSLVLGAETSDVPARNTAALRYGIRPALWEEGHQLDDWIRDAFGAS